MQIKNDNYSPMERINKVRSGLECFKVGDKGLKLLQESELISRTEDCTTSPESMAAKAELLSNITQLIDNLLISVPDITAELQEHREERPGQGLGFTAWFPRYVKRHMVLSALSIVSAAFLVLSTFYLPAISHLIVLSGSFFMSGLSLLVASDYCRYQSRMTEKEAAFLAALVCDLSKRELKQIRQSSGDVLKALNSFVVSIIKNVEEQLFELKCSVAEFADRIELARIESKEGITKNSRMMQSSLSGKLVEIRHYLQRELRNQSEVQDGAQSAIQTCVKRLEVLEKESLALDATVTHHLDSFTSSLDDVKSATNETVQDYAEQLSKELEELNARQEGSAKSLNLSLEEAYGEFRKSTSTISEDLLGLHRKIKDNQAVCSDGITKVGEEVSRVEEDVRTHKDDFTKVQNKIVDVDKSLAVQNEAITKVGKGISRVEEDVRTHKDDFTQVRIYGMRNHYKIVDVDKSLAVQNEAITKVGKEVSRVEEDVRTHKDDFTKVQNKIVDVDKSLAGKNEAITKVEKEILRVGETVNTKSEVIGQTLDKCDALAQNLEKMKQAHIQDSKQSFKLNTTNFIHAQVHQRALSQAEIARVHDYWLPILGLNYSKRSIAYLAHKICRLEDSANGRLATSISAAVLRVLAMLSLKRKSLHILEIGTLFGHAMGIFKSFGEIGGSKVHATMIDPLTGYYGKDELDPQTGVSINREVLELNLRTFGFQKRHYKIIQGFSQDPKSVDAASSKKYDYILLDGDHSYEGLARDFELYGPMVKAGGVLIFDDYDTEEWPDIKKVIDDKVMGDLNWEWIGGQWRTGIFRATS